MEKFLQEAANQNHPLRALKDFLDKEQSLEKAKIHEKRRFVGYVLDIGFGEVTIITCDPFKVAVGGIPRNSLLIMCPASFDNDNVSIPPHFTLLRVLDTAPTPLSFEVQQTYFELQKKSMPELDIFTQSELQWGALKTSVLGMFYPNPDKANTIEFSGDLNNYVSAHKYRVFSPDDALLDLVNNCLVPNENRFQIGKLRLTECRLPLPNKKLPDVNIHLSTNDFVGCRTAMFGKTRLGKSNIVKLIVQSLIETTGPEKTYKVGQIIFDINGEYANDNPQDDNTSIRSAYPDKCTVYALNQKPCTPSELLKLNFYEEAASSKQVLNSLIIQSGRSLSDYVKAFLSVELPELDIVNAIPNERINEKIRAIRRLQYYWALLFKAQFSIDENEFKKLIPKANNVGGFSPGFSTPLRDAIYQATNCPTPSPPTTFNQLLKELELIARFRRENPHSNLLVTGSGNPLFEQDDIAILELLEPQPGRSGIIILLPFRIYHDPQAGNYKDAILKLIDEGKTVILDLGNASEEVVRYFSRQLSEAVFYHQMDKFTSNSLGNHFIQLYFEEAHNLFAVNDDEDNTKIYRRFAKEGAKYHIGMVFSTQSPTTISPDLLAQTENFFIAHLASQDDVNRLAKLNVAYDSIKDDILQAKTVGYIRMLTRSHRFVVSMQARRFTPPSAG
jgi:hypothetical protein